MTKTYRNIGLNTKLDEYLRTNVPNVSGFINDTLLLLLQNGVVEGEEFETTDVRARVIRMHLGVIEKEIAELERQRGVLEGMLDDMEDHPRVLWDFDIDEVYRRDHRRGQFDE